ncbi:hypothetical protein GOHSU_27_00720 [Gordonia hirsuta DSM 44140 = NBRC 16056]|uniref:MaoC-like domain-containing protein n=1 Tax=Gordonia hirsuta DSM 44140 = NBRC 16056 TaxID=1121927 RepID=L7LB22_9ACTN|nr:MaoC/PaaZ C-terminal domain-containing protein [Gordonia hirsuta]GAC57936.1 hypothetical protein GOHSU_27_00720 [Gordonia hirsuta DSM 44140 = NBRC 16056]
MIGAGDLQVGAVYRLGEYALTGDDIVAFARQWDPQYFHTDPEAATHSPYGGLIASGIQTLGIMQRLCVESVYAQWKTIAGRTLDQVQFARPVRPGEVLSGLARIAQITLDRDRGRGDVTLDIEMTVADRTVLSARCIVVVAA